MQKKNIQLILLTILAFQISAYANFENAVRESKIRFYAASEPEFPPNNYIVIFMQHFSACNFVLIDLEQGSVKNYSPYENVGLRNEDSLSKEDKNKIEDILHSAHFHDIESEHQVEMIEGVDDGEWIYFFSKIDGQIKKFTHAFPEDKLVLRIIEIYHKLNKA